MPALLMLLTLLAAGPMPQGAIEAKIRGTAQPVEVDLLLRDSNDQWTEVEHKVLPAGTRNVRFESLGPGVYQLLVKGPAPTERFATKVVLGTADTRRTTIEIEPFELTGHVTLGGVNLGSAAIMLRHKELQWHAGIGLDDEGKFRVPMWQRGEFTYTIRGPALPTSYADAVTLEGDSPIRFDVDLPEARISGVVRDAKSGTPIADALVMLQTNAGENEHHVRLYTDAEGKFDFVGVKYGRHIVRVSAPKYVDPEPIEFELDAEKRLRELDVRVDSGRAIAVLVIDAENDPVVDATVFALAGTRLCSRATTDEDGRTSVAALDGEEATLFVVARDAGFGIARVRRDEQPGRLRIYLPKPSSSLLIKARTTEGGAMPQFSLLMRYNGALLPTEIAEELAALQQLHLGTGPESDIVLRNIPTGSYEFWPYRTIAEAEAILASADGGFAAPIQVNVRTGENKIAVKFAAR